MCDVAFLNQNPKWKWIEIPDGQNDELILIHYRRTKTKFQHHLHFAFIRVACVLCLTKIKLILYEKDFLRYSLQHIQTLVKVQFVTHHHNYLHNHHHDHYNITVQNAHVCFTHIDWAKECVPCFKCLRVNFNVCGLFIK